MFEQLKMDEKNAGPWDIPLKNYVKDFQMMVTIYNIKNDCIIKEITINYGDFEDRKFLGKLTFWACSSGHSVETMSLEDWKAAK